MAAAYSWGIKLVQIGTRIARNHGVYAKDQCHVIHVRENPIPVCTSHATASSLLPSCCHHVRLMMMQQSWIAQQARLIDRSIGLPRPEGIRLQLHKLFIPSPIHLEIKFCSTLVLCVRSVSALFVALSLSLSLSLSQSHVCVIHPQLGTIIAAEAV
jgi:hypothetical protein